MRDLGIKGRIVNSNCLTAAKREQVCIRGWGNFIPRQNPLSSSSPFFLFFLLLARSVFTNVNINYILNVLRQSNVLLGKHYVKDFPQYTALFRNKKWLFYGD